MYKENYYKLSRKKKKTTKNKKKKHKYLDVNQKHKPFFKKPGKFQVVVFMF